MSGSSGAYLVDDYDDEDEDEEIEEEEDDADDAEIFDDEEQEGADDEEGEEEEDEEDEDPEPDFDDGAPPIYDGPGDSGASEHPGPTPWGGAEPPESARRPGAPTARTGGFGSPPGATTITTENRTRSRYGEARPKIARSAGPPAAVRVRGSYLDRQAREAGMAGSPRYMASLNPAPGQAAEAFLREIEELYAERGLYMPKIEPVAT